MTLQGISGTMKPQKCLQIISGSITLWKIIWNYALKFNIMQLYDPATILKSLRKSQEINDANYQKADSEDITEASFVQNSITFT